MGAALTLCKNVRTVGKVKSSKPTVEELLRDIAKEQGISPVTMSVFKAISSKENASKVTAKAAFAAFGHLRRKA